MRDELGEPVRDGFQDWVGKFMRDGARRKLCDATQERGSPAIPGGSAGRGSGSAVLLLCSDRVPLRSSSRRRVGSRRDKRSEVTR